MDMWPNDFTVGINRSPKEIVDQQCSYLERATNAVVYANSYKSKPDPGILIMPGDNSKLWYRMDIRGKYLEDYYFRLISYCHGIELYPCDVMIEKSIADDIKKPTKCSVKNEDEFVELLKLVIGSERLRNIIGSMIKLSS